MAHAPHEVLGIPPSATALEARAAYRRLAFLHHPDRNPSDPRAGARFQRIMAAYRAFRRRGRTAPPPAAPRPDRYECGCCGDTFPFPLSCPRCDEPLHDRSAGLRASGTDPRVVAYMRFLESRPEEPEPSRFEQLPVPGLLAAGSVAAAALSLQIGPLGPAILFMGFAAYVTTMEIARRARTIG